MIKTKILILSLITASFSAQAYKYVGATGNKDEEVNAGCQAPTTQTDLNINNVRARLLGAGDMWWDLLGNARYEVPKGGGVHSMFIAGLWVGGFDAGNNLRLAAVRYRSGGVDWYTGPLNSDAAISQQECKDWDRHFKVDRTEITAFVQDFEDNGKLDDPVPQSIAEWPGRGNKNLKMDMNRPLAPFFDRNGNGTYEPSAGDYPVYDEECTNAKPDQMVWWVINDKGDIHYETGGDQIGLEVHNMAFAFKTNDEINDMTFYRYTLINRSQFSLDSTFMSINVDADLGNPFDDYIGSDTTNDLGFVYNGDANDETNVAPGYGLNIPMAGVDYFQGPKDTAGNQLGMSSFTYYNNCQGRPDCDPQFAAEYYNFMTGTDREGSPWPVDPSGSPAKYAYPGPPATATWTECSEGNAIGDRRFLQNSGPFVLEPGAANEIIIGLVWVPEVPHPCPSLDKILAADVRAQLLFDNCFELLEGPAAPDMAIRELDQELIISLVNTKEVEEFDEMDINQIGNMRAVNATDTTYTFEGYRIYQLARPTVSVSELNDPTKAREIFQVDVKNGVDVLVNYEETPFAVPDPVVKVQGSDEGLKHTFRITQDAFAIDVKRLVNHKKYYYTVISYAANNFKQYNPLHENETDTAGQKRQYLEGTENVRIYTAIPHEFVEAGVELNSQFGDAPEITRLDGKGNGGFYLDLSQKSVDEILASTTNEVGEIVYKANFGPVEVKVYDPFLLMEGRYRLYLEDVLAYRVDSAGQVYQLQKGDILTSGASQAEVVRFADARGETQPDESVKTFGSAVVDMTNGPVFKAGDTIIVNNSDTIVAAKDLMELQGWTLFDAAGDTVATHERVASTDYEQVIIDQQTGEALGFSVKVGFAQNPGDEDPVTNNGFIGANKIYADEPKAWLSGIADEDDSTRFNWIRSGSDNFGGVALDDYGIDTVEAFEGILEGTWAPYRLANRHYFNPPGTTPLLAPAWNNAQSQASNPLDSLNSVNIVFTSDKSKWTRVVVVETQPDSTISEGGARKMHLREHASLNKDGSYDSSEKGYSWFPGYAINLETGERLNMMFGENSRWVEDNGRDMIWNPSKNRVSSLGQSVYGGGHYVYVMRSRYNEAQTIHALLTTGTTATLSTVYRDAMWVGVPLATSDDAMLSFEEGLIPTETTVELRVAKPYSEYVVNNLNEGKPVYEFSTEGMGPSTANMAELQGNALDSIRVVPNPYYAYSAYETSQLDNKVKITNLPKVATISIYTIDGTLIRTINRGITADTHKGGDDITNAAEWDLKNQKNIPIASGVYLIHINAPGIGEKVVKWMGIIRPVDLDSF